jgi:hypothetical protein
MFDGLVNEFGRDLMPTRESKVKKFVPKTIPVCMEAFQVPAGYTVKITKIDYQYNSVVADELDYIGIDDKGLHAYKRCYFEGTFTEAK